MKRIFYTTILTIIFSCAFYCTLFAYTFPNDFDYVAAGNKLDSNAMQYSIGNYCVSRYPYSGDDSNYFGKFSQNYAFNNPVYVLGFMQQNGYAKCYVFSTSTFQAQRYNLQDAFENNTFVTGGALNGNVLASNTNFGDYNDLKTVLINSGKTWYWNSFTLSDTALQDYYYNFSLYDSVDSFLQALYEHNYDVPVTGGGESGSSGDLPFLSYTLKQQIAPNISTPTVGFAYKEIFTWDYTEKEPYASNPAPYTFDIMAYANFKTVTANGITSEIFDRDNLTVNESNRVFLTRGGQNIAINNFSFMYPNIGKSVYSLSGKDFIDNSINTMTLGYIVAIRTRNSQTNDSSFWKLFIVQSGGSVFSTGKVITKNGDIIDSTADNSNDNMNGSGSGGTNYTTDSNTSAEEDTTGTVYTESSGLNIGTVIGSLKSLVNSLGQLPNILTQLLTFLPDWFTSLLVISIALFVTVGIVKLVVK